MFCILAVLLHSAELICKNQFSRQQLVAKLNKLNCNNPLGTFNPSFVSFTYNEIVNFRSIIFKVNGTASSVDSKQTFSLASAISPSKFVSIQLGACQLSDGSGFVRMCEACPVATFLGENIIPPFINEVTCGNPGFCSRLGFCKETVLTQQFLRRTGRCDDDDFEEMEPFEQTIRVCCLCFAPADNL